MVKVGITGQNGFIGQYLFNILGLFPDEFERISFERDYFEDDEKLQDFVKQCNVIVHLAGLNRHDDLQVISESNIDLANKLVKALEKSGSNPHLLFSSSSQEEQDNPYGRSKKQCRETFIKWSQKHRALFTGLIIPNVFGPFGNAYYNSFIATFCYQLTHKELPFIETDNNVKLIYVADLVDIIVSIIRKGLGNSFLKVSHTDNYKVSEILDILKSFKDQYYNLGIIPSLQNSFELNLFNTFRSYIDLDAQYPILLSKHSDARGSFVEVIRLNSGGQVSFSTTMPDVTRGNHFHTRKIERFAVIKGKAIIQLRRIGTKETIDLHVSGDDPAYVDMPVWYTHNIKNIGTDELYTIFWINEFYNTEDPDTYFEMV